MSNDTTASASIPKPQPVQPYSISVLLGIYDDCKGDWCAIARAVEKRYITELDAVRAALARAPLPAPSDVVAWQNRMAPDQIIEGKNPPDASDKWVALVYADRAPLPVLTDDEVYTLRCAAENMRSADAENSATIVDARFRLASKLEKIANRLSAAPAQADEARDAARLDKMIDWYLRGGQRSEIHPYGHIEHTTREHILAWLDRTNTTGGK